MVGTLFDSSGKPAPGRVIHFLRLDSDIGYQAETDDRGQFVRPLRYAGAWLVVPADSDMEFPAEAELETREQRARAFPKERIMLRAGARLELDIRLPLLARPQVVVSQDGLGVAGAKVRFRSADARRSWVGTWDGPGTNQAGKVTLPRTRGGLYNVFVRLRDWEIKYPLTEVGRNPVQLRLGAHVLRVSYARATSQPVPIRITCRRGMTLKATRRLPVDVPFVRAGQTKVETTVGLLSLSKTVPVSGKDVLHVIVLQRPPHGTLRIRFPAKTRALIVEREDAESGIARPQPNADGVTEVALPPGLYRVRHFSHNTTTWSSVRVVRVLRNEVVDIRLFAQDPVLKGRVYDAAGRPLVERTVDLHRLDRSELTHVLVGKDGRFVKRLAPARWVVVPVDEETPANSLGAARRWGQARPNSVVDLRDIPKGRIEVRLQEKIQFGLRIMHRGHPVPHARVRLIAPEGTWVVADATGVVRLLPRAPGEYRAWVSVRDWNIYGKSVRLGTAPAHVFLPTHTLSLKWKDPTLITGLLRAQRLRVQLFEKHSGVRIAGSVQLPVELPFLPLGEFDVFVSGGLFSWKKRLTVGPGRGPIEWSVTMPAHGKLRLRRARGTHRSMSLRSAQGRFLSVRDSELRAVPAGRYTLAARDSTGRFTVEVEVKEGATTDIEVARKR